jgi:hypothetical protein
MPRDKDRKRVGVAVDVRTQQRCIVEGIVLRPALDQASTSTS